MGISEVGEIFSVEFVKREFLSFLTQSVLSFLSHQIELMMRSLNGQSAVGPRPALGAKAGRSMLIVKSVAEAQRSKTSSKGSSSSALPSVLSKVQSIQGKSPEANITAKDAYAGVAYDVRDALIEKFNKTHAHWAVSRLNIIQSNWDQFNDKIHRPML